MTESTTRATTSRPTSVPEAAFRAAIEQAADAILWATTDGRIVYANKEAVRRLGYSQHELLKLSVPQIHPGMSGDAWASLCSLAGLEGPVTHKGIHRRKDGSIVPVEVRACLIDVDGQAMVCATARDISGTIEAEAEANLVAQQYRSLLQQSSEAVFCYEYDPPIPTAATVVEQIERLYDGVLAECNEIAARSYGLQSVDEAIGRTLSSLFGPPTDSVDLLFRQFVEDGYRTVDAESSRQLPDGSTRYFLNNGAGEIVDGGLIRVWGTYRDITRERLVERALRESESRFSTAFHTNPDPMIIASEVDGTLTAVNDAFLHLFGYQRQEVLFRPTADLNLWDDPGDYERIKNLLTDGSPVRRLEAQVRTSSGETRFAEVSASRLDIENASSTLFVIRDLTNQKRAEYALQKSEEMFAKVFRSSPHLVTITTLSGGVFVDVNETFERTSGYSRNEIVGRTAVEMEVWGSESERRMFANTLAEHGRVRDLDIRWRVKSGETRDGQVSAEIIEVSGEPCIISIIQDVTERKKAEEAQRRSEERFAAAFHSSPHLVAITSLETGELIDVNEGFERLSGFTRSEAIGRRTLDLNLWGSPELRADFLQQIRTEGRVHEMEAPLRGRDGEEKIGLISAQPIVVNGETCVITVIQDVTHRKKTENALKDYAQRLQTLLDIDSAILASDSVNTIVTAATRHLIDIPGCIHVGCYIRELGGNRIRRVGGHTRREYSPEFMDIADHQSVLAPVLSGQTLVVEDAKAAMSTVSPSSAALIENVGMGSFFMVPLTVKGQHLGALGVVFDEPNAFHESHVQLASEIAKPLAVAIERMQLQDELRRTNARLSTLSQKLVEAQEAERRYLANELHDHIGQMLTAAKLSLQQARDLTGEDSMAGALDQHIQIIGDTLEQVRGLSLSLRPSLLDDLGLVPTLRWFLEHSVVEDGLQTRLDADPSIRRLPNDVELTCFRVAQEALSNASRHSGAKTVDVSLERRTDRVVLRISDDGCGFDVDQAYARAAMGNSLGLLSIGERVRLAGGSLNLHSTVGKGTIVEVELPVFEEALETN